MVVFKRIEIVDKHINIRRSLRVIRLKSKDGNLLYSKKIIN